MKHVLIFLLVVPFMVFGQKYHKGTIHFSDGKTLTCLINPPSNPYDKKIETKVSEKSDKVSYKSEDIKSVTIATNDSSQYEFVWGATKKITGGLDYSWFYVILKGYATLYGSSDGFKINKKGELILFGKSSGFSVPGSTPDFCFYAQREGEKYATLIGLYSPGTSGLNNFFRKSSSDYFKDSPEVVQRLKDKEFKIGDIVKVVSEYNNLKTKSGAK